MNIDIDEDWMAGGYEGPITHGPSDLHIDRSPNNIQ